MAGRVRIPRTEIDVHPLCLGGNVFGWTADADTSGEVLDAYTAAGGDFVDTADSYTWRVEGNSGGDSERVLGAWMADRGCRDAMVVATKVGSWPQRPGLSAENIRAACEDSLRRLRTDHIDLYYAHRDDPDTPLEETLVAFDGLVRDGKIRHVGLSNYTAERLESALAIVEGHGLTHPVALQPHYNLVERAEFEDALADVAERADLGVMPYFALAKGFLTGKYRPGDAQRSGAGPWGGDAQRSGAGPWGGDAQRSGAGPCGGGDAPPAGVAEDPMASARAGGAHAYLDDRGAHVLAVLDEVAAARGAPVASVALAWLAAQPSVTTPIASARTVEQLGQVLPMAELTLADDELAALTEASEDTRLDG